MLSNRQAILEDSTNCILANLFWFVRNHEAQKFSFCKGQQGICDKYKLEP